MNIPRKESGQRRQEHKAVAEAAEKFGDAAVLVGGADFNEVLANPIKSMTTAARKLGITDGMTGREAAMILNL